MTDEQGKALEATPEGRAALAEVDRLNATTERLLADCEAVRAVASKALGRADAGGDEAHLVGLVVDRMREAERERDALRAEVERLTKERDDYAARLSTLPSLDEATAFATVASALAAVVRPDTDHDYRREQAKRGMDALQSAKVHAARRAAALDAASKETP